MQIYESWGSFVCCLDLEKKKKKERQISHLPAAFARQRKRDPGLIQLEGPTSSQVSVCTRVVCCEAPG